MVVPRSARSIGLDGEVSVRGRFPAHALGGRQPGPARQHGDSLRHDERGIEAHAELADELRVLLAGRPQSFLKKSAVPERAMVPRLRDRVFAAHADAVVADRERAFRGIGLDPDREFGVAGHQLRLAERCEAQLVVGIGGVGNQLTQEDFPVAVQRMDHELEQLTNFGLEAERFFGRACGPSFGFGGCHGAREVAGAGFRIQARSRQRGGISACARCSRWPSPCSSSCIGSRP